MAAKAKAALEIPSDPVIEAYKKDIDRTLLRERLKRTPDERLRDLQSFVNDILKLRGAARQRP